MSAAAIAENGPNDVRPVIATGSANNIGLWVFLGVLLVGGLLLFNALTAAREDAAAPSVLVPDDVGRGQIASPPPLRTPERFDDLPREALRDIEPAAAGPSPELVRPQPQPILPPASYVPPAPPPARLEQPDPAQTESREPRVVFEAARTAPVETAAPERTGDERVSARRLRNPSHTVPQGTVIPAVLETALDSTNPGGVRGLVQRDVASFDGTRVLIPRGSRLYGQYDANLRQGQKRALVQWTRLIRPDGVTVALDSPSSDPLGRAGIRGKVDSKFFQRFGGALLQSVLDLGVGVAVSEATDGVVVALPGSTQNIQVADQQAIQPTLKVRHGTSVSVFVARDLDFSSVDP